MSNPPTTVEEKRKVAPNLTVVCPEGTIDFSNQTFQDVALCYVPDVNRPPSLWPLSSPGKMSRVVLLVFGFEEMQAQLDADPKWLFRECCVMELEKRALTIFRDEGSAYAALVWMPHLFEFPRVRKSDNGLLFDLWSHFVSVLPRRVELQGLELKQRGVAGVATLPLCVFQPTPFEGYWAGPFDHTDNFSMKWAHSIIATEAWFETKPMLCGTNLFYGHEEILSTYCGTNRYPILGRVQHGWSPVRAIPVDEMSQNHTSFVWSDRDEHIAKAGGAKKVVKIGSPYLYLREDPMPAAKDDGIRSVLAGPHHSINQHRIPGDAWGPYVEWLNNNFGDFEVKTACLNWFDYHNAQTRLTFEVAGWRTVTCGEVGIQHNPFLRKLRHLLRTHNHMTSNRLGTMTFYAAFEGCRVSIGGPPMKSYPEIEFEGASKDNEAWGEMFPAIFSSDSPKLETDLNQHVEACGAIGAQHQRGPSELRALLFDAFE